MLHYPLSHPHLGLFGTKCLFPLIFEYFLERDGLDGLRFNIDTLILYVSSCCALSLDIFQKIDNMSLLWQTLTAFSLSHVSSHCSILILSFTFFFHLWSIYVDGDLVTPSFWKNKNNVPPKVSPKLKCSIITTNI